MLYLSETSGRGLQQETTKDTMEDEIDQLLKNRDGLIHRDRDPQLYCTLRKECGHCTLNMVCIQRYQPAHLS